MNFRHILVLGMGCRKCIRLEENVRKALAALGLDEEVSKITDADKIAEYGVMATPALVVDGEVLISGTVPGADELENLLSGLP